MLLHPCITFCFFLIIHWQLLNLWPTATFWSSFGIDQKNVYYLQAISNLAFLFSPSYHQVLYVQYINSVLVNLLIFGHFWFCYLKSVMGLCGSVVPKRQKRWQKLYAQITLSSVLPLLYRVLLPQKAVGTMWNGACAINYSLNTCGENQTLV